MNSTTRPLLGCTALLTLFALGCNQESLLTPPLVTTILVQPAPEGIAAPWTLTGPDGEATEGVGARTLLDLEPGDYTLTWGALESWRMPSPTITTKNLELDGSLTFKGVYEAAMLAPEGFVYVAPGTFIMGSPASEPGRSAHEVQHEVTLTRGFYIAEHEVTVQAWADVMGGPSSIWLLPITYVSWDMAVQFCNALSLREGLIPAYTILGPNGNVTWNRTANGYRLPTEAEWEYACRAGTTMAYNNDSNCLSSETEANFSGFFPLDGCPPGKWGKDATYVGSFAPNAWGLYDMHGNVWEWVWDVYRADYENLSATDPVQDDGSPGSPRVLRGGGWKSSAAGSRSAFRGIGGPVAVVGSSGLRLVRSAL